MMLKFTQLTSSGRGEKYDEKLLAKTVDVLAKKMDIGLDYLINMPIDEKNVLVKYVGIDKIKNFYKIKSEDSTYERIEKEVREAICRKERKRDEKFKYVLTVSKNCDRNRLIKAMQAYHGELTCFFKTDAERWVDSSLNMITRTNDKKVADRVVAMFRRNFGIQVAINGKTIQHRLTMVENPTYKKYDGKLLSETGDILADRMIRGLHYLISDSIDEKNVTITFRGVGEIEMFYKMKNISDSTYERIEKGVREAIFRKERKRNDSNK